MQRLHEDDLVGHVLQQEPWEVVRFPAIAEEDEVHEYSTFAGPKCYRRPKGEALHPRRESLQTLARIRKSVGPYSFAGQYQQAPAPLGGGLVKTAWFTRYAPSDKPEHFDRIIQSWDTASKPGEFNDYSVCTTWGQKEKRLYLLDVLRKQLEFPDLKRLVCRHANLFSAKVVLIEDKASGTQLIQELIRDGMYSVTRYKPVGDKITRMHGQTAMIENGFVLLPSEAPWLDDYLHEMALFPKGRHDDQVDSTSQALDWFQTPIPGWGLFEYYRQQALKTQFPERFRVKLEMPAGMNSSHIGTISGIQLTVQPDRTINACDHDARRLIAQGWKKLDAWYDEAWGS
jgi:predicted phage terminase large subunit-like protein